MYLTKRRKIIHLLLIKTYNPTTKTYQEHITCLDGDAFSDFGDIMSSLLPMEYKSRLQKGK